MSHHVIQENHVSSHLLSSISFITIPQTPLGNSDYHRKLHKPMGFAYSSLFLPHPSLRRRNATEFKMFFVTWLFRKSLLEAMETHKCDCSPNNTIETCVPPPPGGAQERGAWPVKLVEPCAGQEWLWPDGTRDILHRLLPFCWDVVAKPRFAYVVWGYWSL